MKKYLKRLGDKISFWNLFIGLVIGFALGIFALEALVPGSVELIRMYRLDKKSLQEDREVRRAERESFQGVLEIDGN